MYIAVVQPDIFEIFYRSWKDEEMRYKDVNSKVEKHLDSGECVLKLSDRITCSYGNGRIGLTQKR